MLPIDGAVSLVDNLTPEQLARVIYYLKVARQQVARRLTDVETLRPRDRLEYEELDAVIHTLERQRCCDT